MQGVLGVSEIWLEIFHMLTIALISLEMQQAFYAKIRSHW